MSPGEKLRAFYSLLGKLAALCGVGLPAAAMLTATVSRRLRCQRATAFPCASSATGRS